MGLEADHDPALAVYHATLVDQTAPHLVDVGQDSLILGRTAHTSRCILFYWVPCIRKRISREPIYHIGWEHRALYNNTNNTHTHTQILTHRMRGYAWQ